MLVALAKCGVAILERPTGVFESQLPTGRSAKFLAVFGGDLIGTLSPVKPVDKRKVTHVGVARSVTVTDLVGFET